MRRRWAGERKRVGMNKHVHDQERPSVRDWRRVHHSPWFWVGVAMFLVAILTYVFSEDLSLRPKLRTSLDADAPHDSVRVAALP